MPFIPNVIIYASHEVYGAYIERTYKHTEVEKREIERKLVECLDNPKDLYLPGLEDPNEYRKRLNKKMRDLQNSKKVLEHAKGMGHVQERKRLEQQLQELLQLKEEFEREYGNGRS